MHLILKIGISRNTECVNTVGFPKLGHKYPKLHNTVQVKTTKATKLSHTLTIIPYHNSRFKCQILEGYTTHITPSLTPSSVSHIEGSTDVEIGLV